MLDGVALAMGRNSSGQLGLVGDQSFRPQLTPVFRGAVETAAAGRHHSVLVVGGEALAAGATEKGAAPKAAQKQGFAPVQGIASIASVVAGLDFTLARKHDGSVWAWGHSQYGVLGLV